MIKILGKEGKEGKEIEILEKFEKLVAFILSNYVKNVDF